jgi:hypothetical protein
VLQLYALAQGLVLVAGGSALTLDDRRRVARVAWDGIPVFRGWVLQRHRKVTRPAGKASTSVSDGRQAVGRHDSPPQAALRRRQAPRPSDRGDRRS